MPILTSNNPTDRLRHLPRWLSRTGSLQRMLTALVDYRIYQEIRSAVGTVPLWPSWVHVCPVPVESASVTVTESASGRRVRVYRSADPIGSLYRPTPFFITTSSLTLFFQLGLVESSVGGEWDPATGEYVYRVSPLAQPLERAFLKRGRAWDIVSSERDGTFRLMEEGVLTFRYLPLGPLPSYLGPDGFPLQVTPFQYWQRGLALLAGLTDTDRMPVGVLLEKVSRLGPPMHLFGIAGELELSRRVEHLQADRPTVLAPADASYHEHYRQLVRLGRNGSVRLASTPVPHVDLWTVRGLRLNVPQWLATPGTVFASGRVDSSGRWTGELSLSEGAVQVGSSLATPRWTVSVQADRVVSWRSLPWVSVAATAFGVGYLPVPVYGWRGSIQLDEAVSAWGEAWEDPWQQRWEDIGALTGDVGGWSGGWDGLWQSVWDEVGTQQGPAVSVQAQHWLIPLQESGRLWGWGTSTYGEAGVSEPVGSGYPVWLPLRLPEVESLVCAATGAYHSLVLTRTGLYACGSNRYGQWGIGAADLEHVRHALTDITEWLPEGVTPADIRQVAVGTNVSFLVLRDGRVYGAGGSAYGVLGLGSSGTESNPLDSWTLIPGLTGIREIVVTERNAFAIGWDGSLKVSGDNSYGQYGNGTLQRADGWAAVDLSEMGGVYRLSVDDSVQVTVMAIDDQRHALWGWGSNRSGRLGADVGALVTVPVRVGLSVSGPVSDVKLGGVYPWAACIVGGKVYAWGDRRSGVPCLDHTQRAVSAPLVYPQSAVELAAQRWPGSTGQVTAACRHPYEALWFLVDGDLYVWGDLIASHPFPGDSDPKWLVLSLRGVRHASVPNHPGDGGLFGLAIDRNGVLRATGEDRYGCAGWGQYPTEYLDWEPVQLAPQISGRLVRLYTNGWSCCVVDDSGVVYVAGANHCGQLGLGSGFGDEVGELTVLFGMLEPLREAVLPRNADADQPIAWSLYLAQSGNLYACGDNSFGQLGLGDTANRSLPVLVASGVRAVSAVCADDVAFSAYLTEDGRLYVMGDMYTGADGLGSGQHRIQNEPVLVHSIPQGEIRLFAVTVGGGLLALDQYGDVWAWGRELHGELGTGRQGGTIIDEPIRVFRAGSGVRVMGSCAHCSYLLTEDGLLLAGYVPYGSAVQEGAVAPCFDWSGYFIELRLERAVRLASGLDSLFVVCADSGIYHIGRLPFHPYDGSAVRGVVQPLQLWRYRTVVNS